jgi:hypothetical protein
MKFPEFEALDRYRIQRDWTFEQLAAAMKKAKVPVPLRTLHYLLKRRPAHAVPLDRTMYKIHTFLKHERVLWVRRRRARRAPTTSPSATV